MSDKYGIPKISASQLKTDRKEVKAQNNPNQGGLLPNEKLPPVIKKKVDLDNSDEEVDCEIDDEDEENEEEYEIEEDEVEDEEEEEDFDNNFKIQYSSKYYVPPPLPLVRFDPDSTGNPKAYSIGGSVMPSIPNSFDSNPNYTGDSLFDPVLSRRLIRWFSARASKEFSIRQMEGPLTDMGGGLRMGPTFSHYTAYEYSWDVLSKEEENDTVPSLPDPTSTKSRKSHASSSSSVPLLNFDADFECGNLDTAVLVQGREGLLTHRALERLSDFSIPCPAQQEYDLVLRKDLNTDGNIQWYYFSATPSEGFTFPIKIRFNIINMQKKESLYNFGMRPAVFDSNDPSRDWKHIGEDICYFKNLMTYLKPLSRSSRSGKKKRKLRGFYTLTFSYTFTGPQAIYFAHCYPYTYSDLQRYLNSMQQSPKINNFMTRKVFCLTLAGNSCDLITISERSIDPEEYARRPAIIVSARVHPGESNSSYMMHGFLEFILSDAPEAVILRRNFIFKIVPMLNPDGVVHGNYRCSLVGCDLNRRYRDCHPSLHPTISAMKAMMRSTHTKRGVLLYLDLHGHSKLKNAFLYGCDVTLQPEKLLRSCIPSMTKEWIQNQRIFSRIFPKVLSEVATSHHQYLQEVLEALQSLSPKTPLPFDLNRFDLSKPPKNYFSYRDCCFSVDASKLGTGRVVGWREFNIPGAYTIELSFCGPGDNNEGKILKKIMEQHPSLQPLESLPSSNSIPSLTPSPPANLSLSMSFSTPDIVPFSRSSEVEGAGGVEGGGGGEKKIKADSSDSDPSTQQSSGQWGTRVSHNHESLLQSYQTISHYTKNDYKRMGTNLGLAILHFANMQHLLFQSDSSGLRSSFSKLTMSTKLGTETPKSTKENGGGGVGVGVVSFDDSSSPNNEERLLPTPLCVFSSEMSDQPLVQAGVYALDALKSMLSEPSPPDSSPPSPSSPVDTPTPIVEENLPLDSNDVEAAEPQEAPSTPLLVLPEHKSLRSRCEMEIRKFLQLDMPPSAYYSSGGSGLIDILTDEFFSSSFSSSKKESLMASLGLEAGAGEGEGSDSDPSGDNIAPSKFMKDLSKFKTSKALIVALRKVTNKKRKDELDRLRKEARRAAKKKFPPKKVEDTSTQPTAPAPPVSKPPIATPKKRYVVKKLTNNNVQGLPRFIPAYRLNPEAEGREGQVSVSHIVLDGNGITPLSSFDSYPLASQTPFTPSQTQPQSQPQTQTPFIQPPFSVPSNPSPLNSPSSYAYSNYTASSHSPTPFNPDSFLSSDMAIIGRYAAPSPHPSSLPRPQSGGGTYSHRRRPDSSPQNQLSLSPPQSASPHFFSSSPKHQFFDDSNTLHSHDPSNPSATQFFSYGTNFLGGGGGGGGESGSRKGLSFSSLGSSPSKPSTPSSSSKHNTIPSFSRLDRETDKPSQQPLTSPSTLPPSQNNSPSQSPGKSSSIRARFKLLVGAAVEYVHQNPSQGKESDVDFSSNSLSSRTFTSSSFRQPSSNPSSPIQNHPSFSNLEDDKPIRTRKK